MSAGEERLPVIGGSGGTPDRPDDSGGGGEGRGEHLGWRISALLDDELSGAEEAAARDHLSTCDRCQQEFAEIMAARTLVRSLGEVEPPVGALDRIVRRIIRRRQITGIGILGLVTLMAAWILVLFFVVRVSLPALTPPASTDIRVHAQLSSDRRTVPAGFTRLDPAAIASLEAPYVAPGRLGSFTRDGVYRNDGTVLVDYRNDLGSRVSVFEQVGVLDVNALPDGSLVGINGHDAVLQTFDQPVAASVLELPRHPVVFTVVGETASDVVDAAKALPEPRDFSLGDRVRRNVRDVFKFFGIESS